MNDAEKELALRWGQAWKEAGPKLEAIRRQEIRATNTLLSIPAFDGLFEAAVRTRPPRDTSGLVEQQRWFHVHKK